MTLDSQSLNLNARQILIKRLSTVQALAYTGPLGELIIDTTLKQVRVQDGSTPGGVLMVTSNNLSNIQSQIDSLRNNLDPALIDSFTEIVANVNALLANNTESSLVNSGFYANLTPTGNLVVDGAILPKTHLAQDLGSSTMAWRSLYLSNATAYFGNSALTVGANGLTVTSGGNILAMVGNVRFPDGTVQSTAVNQATVANIYTLLTANVAANLNAIHGDVTNAISYFGGIVSNAVTPVQSNVSTLLATKDRITNGSANLVVIGGANPLVIFPAIASGANILVQGSNISGSVGNLAITSANHTVINTGALGTLRTYTFGDDGNLTFPDGSKQSTAFVAYVDSNVAAYLPTFNGNIKVSNVRYSDGSYLTSNKIYTKNNRFDIAFEFMASPAVMGETVSFDLNGMRVSGNTAVFSYKNNEYYVFEAESSNQRISFSNSTGYIKFGSSTKDGTGTQNDIELWAYGGNDSHGNVYISAGSSPTNRRWTFNSFGKLTLPGDIVGYQTYINSNPLDERVTIQPSGSVNKPFKFITDQNNGTWQRSMMELPGAEVNKAVTLGFPHNSGPVGFIYTQGTDTISATEFNNAFNIMANGTDVKIGVVSIGGNKVWKFDANGAVTFPDTTVQSTAYTGQTSVTWQQVNLTVSSPVSALYLTAASTEYIYVTTSNESRNIRLPDATTLTVGRRFVVRNSGNAGLPVQNSAGTAFNFSIYQNQTVIATVANVSVNSTSSWMLDVTGSALTGSGAHVMAFAPTLTSPVLSGISKIGGVQETFSSLTNATGTVNHDCSNTSTFRHVTPAANWTANFTNLYMQGGYNTTLSIVIEQGSTAYYPDSLQIQGVGQTINWQGNIAPTPTPNRIDVVNFTVLYNSGTYTVLGRLTGF